MCHNSIHIHTIVGTEVSPAVIASTGTYQTVTFYMENGSTFTIYAYYEGENPQVMYEMKRKKTLAPPTRRIEDMPRQLDLPGIEKI